MIQHRHLVTLGAAACVALSLGTAWGAELRGRMTLASGQPAANEAIQLKDKEIGRTDGAGAYLLKGCSTAEIRVRIELAAASAIPSS